MFLRDTLPWWLAPVGYGGLAILSTIFIPMVLAPVKWYYVAVAYVITPLFALPNSYGCGLTDWDCSSMYAKLALFIFAAWAGVEVRSSWAECAHVMMSRLWVNVVLLLWLGRVLALARLCAAVVLLPVLRVHVAMPMTLALHSQSLMY